MHDVRMDANEEHELYSRPENQEPQGAPSKRAENQRVYTRRQYLTYHALMESMESEDREASTLLDAAIAEEAVASWAIENPDVDMDEQKLTWAEWQAENER